MIVALAGRRVDPVGAKHSRFSSAPQIIDLVRRRIRETLVSKQAIALVSSAACGADLLALSEAGYLHLQRRVLLPFDRETFRSTSVMDRPGDWGQLYDAVIDEVQQRGDLLIFGTGLENCPYIKTNHRIINEALSLGRSLQEPVMAVRVWEGQSRGEGDLTEEFGIYAGTKGVSVSDVMTG
jgi:hypothetical protein